MVLHTTVNYNDPWEVTFHPFQTNWPVFLTIVCPMMVTSYGALKAGHAVSFVTMSFEVCAW